MAARIPTPPIILEWHPGQIMAVPPGGQIQNPNPGEPRILVSVLGNLFSCVVDIRFNHSVLGGTPVNLLRRYGVPTRPSNFTLRFHGAPSPPMEDEIVDIVTMEGNPVMSQGRVKEEVTLDITWFERETVRIDFLVLPSFNRCVRLGRDFIAKTGFTVEAAVGGWGLRRDRSMFYAFDEKCIYCPLTIQPHTTGQHQGLIAGLAVQPGNGPVNQMAALPVGPPQDGDGGQEPPMQMEEAEAGGIQNGVVVVEEDNEAPDQQQDQQQQPGMAPLYVNHYRNAERE